MGKGHKKGIHCSQMTEQRSQSIFKFSTEPDPVADTNYTDPCGKFHLEGSQCTIQIAQASQKPFYGSHYWSDTALPSAVVKSFTKIPGFCSIRGEVN